MISVEDVYNLLIDELRVDERGLSCGLDEYNRLIRVVNQEIYNDKVRKFEEDQDNIDALGSLKVHNYAIDLTTGVGTLPSDYARAIGRPRILDSDSITRYVDIVTEFEHGSREEDFLTQASLIYPTARIGGISASYQMQIRVTPTSVSTIYLDYLRTLVVPFLDYYVNDTTLNYTFLDDTDTLQAIPVGSTYRDGSPGTGVATTISLTRDIDWGEEELALIITKLVNRVAKQLPDELLLQTSEKEQLKSDSE